MANIHILEQNDTTYRVAYHYPVPGTNNSAGVSYQAALFLSGLIQPTGLQIIPHGVSGAVGVITQAEATQILQGQVVEEITTFNIANVNPQTLAAVTAALTSDYNAKRTARLTALAGQLKWFGATI